MELMSWRLPNSIIYHIFKFLRLFVADIFILFTRHYSYIAFQSEKPRKKQAKKEKDENKPKRPPTAFMLYLNANREKIKSDNPGIAVTDIAKKGGEMWRDLKDKSVCVLSFVNQEGRWYRKGAGKWGGIESPWDVLHILVSVYLVGGFVESF